MTELTMVEAMLRAEAALDRELTGLALIQPQIIAKIDIRPEVDIAAIEFFKRFDARKEDILAADQLEAIKIAYDCVGQRDFFKFWSGIYMVNTFQTAPEFGAELIAVRVARKAILWLEANPDILQRGVYDG